MYNDIPEEELKNKIAQDYFGAFDCTTIIQNLDFCVAMRPKDQKQGSLFKDELESLLWAEAKKGTKNDIYESFVQLILTIGKERTFDKFNPPPFLGAFDAEKIAFLPYTVIHDVFYQNDFNWNVAPSNHDTKEFQHLYTQVREKIEQNSLLFKYKQDKKDIKNLIKENFILDKLSLSKIQIVEILS